MRAKNKKRYIEWKNKNIDEYSKEVFEFAERWADLMEKGMAVGKKIENTYEEFSNKANIKRITGIMYYKALKTLVKHWKYGSELKEAIIKNGTGKVISSSSL